MLALALFHKAISRLKKGKENLQVLVLTSASVPKCEELSTAGPNSEKRRLQQAVYSGYAAGVCSQLNQLLQ